MSHTPPPWTWWTSNSWKRLKRDVGGITDNVLEPVVARDGHPDLVISPADMALIQMAPDLLELAEQYASECGECDGTGIYQVDDDEGEKGDPCVTCADIRAVIAKATA